MKLADVKSSTYIDFNKENIKEDLNLKLLIMSEYKNIEIFLHKVTLQIGLKNFFKLRKLKILCCGHMLLVILTVKKLMERFIKRTCKKQIKKSLDLKKLSREKVINYILNGKATIILLTVGLIKKDLKLN